MRPVETHAFDSNKPLPPVNSSKAMHPVDVIKPIRPVNSIKLCLVLILTNL